MSTIADLKAYRFGNPAHWSAALISGATIEPDGAVAPLKRLALASALFPVEGGALAPSVDAHGVAYWRDGAGQRLYWLTDPDTSPKSLEAPAAIARSPRLVAHKKWLWAFSSNCLARFELTTLEHEDGIEFKSAEIVDIAGDARDGVWVLLREKQAFSIRHVSAKRTGEAIALAHGDPHTGIAYLSAIKRVVLLCEGGGTIMLIDPKNPAAFAKIPLDLESPPIRAVFIDGDRRSRLFVGDAQTIRVLETSGGDIQSIEAAKLGAPGSPPVITGVSASRAFAVVTTSNGAYRFDNREGAVPTDAQPTILTPVLYSPDTATLRGWLRAELAAILPPGTSASIRVMSTNDRRARDRVEHIARDVGLPTRVRQKKIRDALEPGLTPEFVISAPTTVESTKAGAAIAPSTFEVPLFEHRDPWLWLEISLSAPIDGAFPRLKALKVLYPEVSLTQHLPAIFRGATLGRGTETGDPTGLFRRLVGVLETTTQGIDEKIAALGERIRPDRAGADQLDAMARWLDLPWSEALPLKLKQNIVRTASALLSKRGTRNGLRELLECLLPDNKAGIRIIDVGVDFGIATLGGAASPCGGSALPTVLSGRPAHAAVLAEKAVLGRARLTCDEDDACDAGLTRVLRVELTASADERSALEPLLPDLLREVIPAGLAIRVRWRDAANRISTFPFQDDDTLDDVGVRQVGKDAYLGEVTLDGQSPPHLTDAGLNLDFRLR